jgi:hypothetical protein
MPQIFHPSMNTISRTTIFGAVFILAMLGWLVLTFVRLPYVCGVACATCDTIPFLL